MEILRGRWSMPRRFDVAESRFARGFDFGLAIGDGLFD
jgi:hypothetical protein